MASALDIEVALALKAEDPDCEVTISLDYSHAHLGWPPPADAPWIDPLWMIDAIVNEDLVAHSGWLNGELRYGGLCDRRETKPSSSFGTHTFRVRSWKGTYDRDEAASPEGGGVDPRQSLDPHPSAISLRKTR